MQCLTENALSAADDCIEALMDEGWANNQIALLTTNSRHPAHLEHLDAGTIAEYWLDFHTNTGVFYGHVLGFKGLERSVVVLCVNEFKVLERSAVVLCVNGFKDLERGGAALCQPVPGPEPPRGGRRQRPAGGSRWPGA